MNNDMNPMNNSEWLILIEHWISEGTEIGNDYALLLIEIIENMRDLAARLEWELQISNPNGSEIQLCRQIINYGDEPDES